MGDFLKNSLKSKGIRDVALVFSSKAVSAGFGFLTSIILARQLGPEGFGVFSLTLVIMILIAGIMGGSIDQALVKFFSHYSQKNRDKAELFFKVAFKLKLMIGLLLIGASFALSDVISGYLQSRNGLGPNLIKMSFFGSVGIIFFQYTQAVLQSYQSFSKHAILDVSNNLMKFLTIGVLFIFGVLTPANSVFIYIAIPFFSMILGLILIPKNFMRAGGSEKELVAEVLHFSKWIMLSYICFTIYSRLDILLLSQYAGTETVGVYSAAHVVASSLDILSLALFTVILPKVSRFTTRSEFAVFIRKFMKIVSPLSVLTCIAFLAISEPMIDLLYTSEFEYSVFILRILVPGSSLFLIVLPVSSILLAINKPKTLLGIDVIILVCMTSGCFLLVPAYGAIGAAFAVLISKIIFLILILVKVFKEINHYPSSLTHKTES